MLSFSLLSSLLLIVLSCEILFWIFCPILSLLSLFIFVFAFIWLSCSFSSFSFCSFSFSFCSFCSISNSLWSSNPFKSFSFCLKLKRSLLLKILLFKILPEVFKIFILLLYIFSVFFCFGFNSNSSLSFLFPEFCLDLLILSSDFFLINVIYLSMALS